MGLTDWPQELILQVLRDDAIGLHERCSLARVDRCMHQLVLPLLYQSVQIDIPEPKTGNVRKKAFLSFKKTFSEDAGLANLLQKLDVSWHCVQHGLEEPYPANHMAIEPDVGRGIDEILDFVPQLQTLALRRVSRGPQGPNYLPPDNWCRNNVNSPVRTSAIGLLQHWQLLYLPSELDITKYTHNEFTHHLIAIKPQTLCYQQLGRNI